jgi:glycerol-3-phosphate dehydrogenase (NAD(P)+)
MTQITILGSGAWGTALGQVLSGNHCVTMWGRSSDKIQHYKTSKTHEGLEGVGLSEKLQWTSDIHEALAKTDILILAIPTQHTRNALLSIKKHVDKNIPIIQTAKGIEIDTGLLIHQMTSEIFSENPIYLLSGPGFAIDLAHLKPTAVSLAWQEHKNSDIDMIQNLFFQTPLRPYRHHDITGVALGGALKNILAIAAGFCIGYSLGEGAKAAIITRGFNEMMLFAEKLQAEPKTLYGLSGIGDLMLTANSVLSRNYQYGYALGQAHDHYHPHQTTEGYYTLRALQKMDNLDSKIYPIFTALAHLIDGTKSKTEIVTEFLERPLKEEF